MATEGERKLTWNTEEAARAVGVTERHLRRLVKRGEGPPKVLLGRRIVFMPDTIKAWLHEKERPAA